MSSKHWDSSSLLLFLQRVQSQQTDYDYRKFAPFETYKGVEIFLTGGDKFAVFCVEIDAPDELKITIMFAGRRNVPIATDAISWDGIDYRALYTNIISRRAAEYFR
jgi:hypothetical protein